MLPNQYPDSTQIRHGAGSVGSALNGLAAPLESIAQLKAIAAPQGVANVAGYYAAGDGGGGLFKWDATSTATDNGGTIIRPNHAPASGRWIREKSSFLTVNMFGAVGDGVTVSQTSVANAVDFAFNNDIPLYWDGGQFLVTGNIPNFHSIKHNGEASVLSGGNTWAITPTRTTVRKLHISPTGLATNDGLSTATPMTIGAAISALDKFAPIIGRAQIIGTSGVYTENVSIPKGLALNDSYLEFKFPSVAGVRGDPSAWPAGAAILDGSGYPTSNTTAFNIGAYNNVYIEYLLVRNWFNTGLGTTSQVQRAVVVDEFANLYTYGVSYIGNGLSNISVDPCGRAVVTGGIIDGARYGIDNTGGRMSFTASAATKTTVRNSLEYGLYAKHESSTVLDYTEFTNCGKHPAAASYGAAIFAYKSNTSVDTRACEFNQNNIVYNVRGGFVAQNPSLPDVYGTAGDANGRIWLMKGYGQDDLTNYQSIAPRDKVISFGGNSITSSTTALLYDTNAKIPAQYLSNTDQYIEIELFASAVTGTGQIRPSFVAPDTTRYELASFAIAAGKTASIRLIVQPSTTQGVMSVFYSCVNATISGEASGFFTLVSVPFHTTELEFQVWGEITSGTLSLRKARCVLWG